MVLLSFGDQHVQVPVEVIVSGLLPSCNKETKSLPLVEGNKTDLECTGAIGSTALGFMIPWRTTTKFALKTWRAFSAWM